MLETLGILGGMGPLATADFLRKLAESTPARSDQDHIPAIIYSVPQIPDRTSSILGTGPSPLPALMEGARFLVKSGSKAIAIPCNTAHFWHDVLAKEVNVPILHIVDAVRDVLPHARKDGVGPTVGLLATAGTIRSGVYQKRLGEHGIRCLLPAEQDLQTLIMPGIASVKAGDLAEAHILLEKAALRIMKQGAEFVILGCTEIPIALAVAAPDLRPHLVDATSALAARCVRWWRNSGGFGKMGQDSPLSLLQYGFRRHGDDGSTATMR
jgi:aspartate racemase